MAQSQCRRPLLYPIAQASSLRKRDLWLGITQTTEGESTPRIGIRTVAAFAVAFIATAALIHSALPSPLGLYANMRTEKLMLLHDWQGRAASAAFGASSVHNGFDPRAFDSTLAGTPLHTTSINLGVEGGAQSEQRVMALKFVAGLHPHPDQACFVLLHLNAGANFTTDHLIHPRTINIYDWKTVRFIHGLSVHALNSSRDAGRFGSALAATVLYYTNVGMLSNLIFPPPPDPQIISDETKDDRRGYLTPPSPPGNDEFIAKVFSETPRTMQPVPQTLLPGNYALISELQQASPVRNVHFVYFVTPLMRDLGHYPVYPASITVDGGATPILSVARPDLYPELYHSQYWHDDAHLSPSGAALMGKYLADQLDTWYRAHPQSMSCGD